MDIEVIIEGHERWFKSLEQDMSTVKEMKKEIRSMNEALVIIADEQKNTNEYLKKCEQKTDKCNCVSKGTIQQITIAIIAALAGALLSAIIGMLVS